MELMLAHSQCTKGNFTNHCEKKRLFHLVLKRSMLKEGWAEGRKIHTKSSCTLVSFRRQNDPLTSFPSSINKSSTQTANKSFDNLFEYNSLHLHQRNGLNQTALVSIEISFRHHAPSFRANALLWINRYHFLFVSFFFSFFFSVSFFEIDRHECWAI